PRSAGHDNGRFFDDFARMATGAVGAMAGFREHLRQEIKSHLDRFLIELDLVPRSDFEIVEQMAKQARKENEELKKRVAALEGKAAPKAKAKVAAAKPAAKKPVKKTTAKKKATK
ncbi:MAG TPA: accessory factor UbiK family protein, partial [Alphaproteobacteria bacterium]